MKQFNTTGPCRPDIHYMLPAAARLPETRRLIDGQNYFVLHAARQTGKTTSMLALARELTAEGSYAAIVLSVQAAAVFSDDIDTAEKLLLSRWRKVAEDELPPELRPPEWPTEETGQRINAALRAWARAIPRPLVVFLDEIDSLKDDLLLSVLHQLRDGFTYRPKSFPWSLGLIGLRDVRDYKIKSGGSERLNTASPFNIKARSLTKFIETVAKRGYRFLAEVRKARPVSDEGERPQTAQIAKGISAAMIKALEANARLAWIAAAVLLLGLLATLPLAIARLRQSPPAAAVPIRFTVAAPSGSRSIQPPEISPDGRHLLYAAYTVVVNWVAEIKK